MQYRFEREYQELFLRYVTKLENDASIALVQNKIGTPPSSSSVSLKDTLAMPPKHWLNLNRRQSQIKTKDYQATLLAKIDKTILGPAFAWIP